MKDESLTFTVGENVKVKMPYGMAAGKVISVLKNASFCGEVKYEIHGANFITIASSRVMEKNINQHA